MNSVKRIICTSLIGLLSASILLYQSPGFSQELNKAGDSGQIKSTSQIKDNLVPAVAKNNTKPAKDESIDVLRRQLRPNLNSGSTPLNLRTEFTAFPATSTINLTLRDTDIASVLRILAKEAGKNIVLDESVKGNINAELKHVSLNEAMQTILISEELEARVNGNTIFVASRPAMAKKGLNRKYIQTFKLNNANAVDVAKILEASIFNKGYVVNENSSQSASGTALQAVSTQNTNTVENANTGSSTGQSSLVSSKTIRGKVETLESGSGFADASTLASKIKIQSTKAAIEDINVNNNDGGAIVIPDTRTNSVLVAGLQEDILLAKETIKSLDKPLPQVSMEVSLIELNKDDTDDLGLSVSGKGGYISSGFNAKEGAREAVGLITGADNFGIAFNTVRSLSDNVAFKLNALISNHKAKLLANPTVLALDNSESLIKITDQVVSRMTVTTMPNGPTTYSPELSDVGIVLNILPKIGDDNYVTMRIRPSITTPLREVEIGNDGSFATLISTREVILQDARVKAGETLAIAGLIKESDIQDISKVPFAGDLPIFGKLFRNTTKGHSKSELIILITPKIITDIASN